MIVFNLEVVFCLYDYIVVVVLVVFLWQTPETEQFSVPHLHVLSLSLYSNSVNAESDIVWNSLLSKSITVLNVLFTCMDQQRSFWNVLLNWCFTNSQFRQKKKKTLHRRWKYTYPFISNSQHRQWANTFLHPLIYLSTFQKCFHFVNHSCSFLHLWKNKTKKENSDWLALGVEIAFLI